ECAAERLGSRDWRASASPVTASPCCRWSHDPGRNPGRTRRPRTERRARGGDPGRRQWGRPAGSGGIALSLRGGQQCAELRPCAGARLPSEHRRRYGDTVRTGAEANGGTCGVGRRPAGLRVQGRGHGSTGMKISRQAYTEMFGPTVVDGVGDRVRLADTGLLAEVEKDFCIRGEEVKFGGGK